MKNEKIEREIANCFETLHWEIFPFLGENKRKLIQRLFLKVEDVANEEIDNLKEQLAIASEQVPKGAFQFNHLKK